MGKAINYTAPRLQGQLNIEVGLVNQKRRPDV